MNEIIIAVITGVVSLGVCMINNYFQGKKTTALIEYRLSQLENKVDKHNNVVERTYHLEEQVHIHDEKLKVANHRIDDLEHKEGA